MRKGRIRKDERKENLDKEAEDKVKEGRGNGGAEEEKIESIRRIRGETQGRERECGGDEHIEEKGQDQRKEKQNLEKKTRMRRGKGRRLDKETREEEQEAKENLEEKS